MDFIIFMGAVFLGGFIGYRGGRKSVKPALNEILVAQAHDRMNFLTGLRRELANYLIWCDPDRYVSLYKVVHAETSSFKDLEAIKRDARLATLCKKYERYEDFDLVGTRDYVLYPDTLWRYQQEEIERRYRDIVNFQASMIATNRHWKWFKATSDEEFQHLNKYVRSVKDTQARQRFEQAIREHYIWRAGNEAPLEAYFEWPDFSVERVPHYAENRYGIHDKKTNQYGLYGFFVADDGKIYHSYYRSDPAFESEKLLDESTDILEFTRLHSPR